MTTPPLSSHTTSLTIRIQDKIHAKLMPTHLEVIDNSQEHAGHPGSKSGGGHFIITISSPKFKNKNLIDCHRLIYDALQDMLKTDIHALSINIIKE